MRRLSTGEVLVGIANFADCRWSRCRPPKDVGVDGNEKANEQVHTESSLDTYGASSYGRSEGTSCGNSMRRNSMNIATILVANSAS